MAEWTVRWAFYSDRRAIVHMRLSERAYASESEYCTQLHQLVTIANRFIPVYISVLRICATPHGQAQQVCCCCVMNAHCACSTFVRIYGQARQVFCCCVAEYVDGCVSAWRDVCVCIVLSFLL